MDALAITNHGHVNSYPHAFLHVEKLKKQGVDFKYIPGCEFYLHPSIDEWKELREQRILDKKIEKESKDSDVVSTIENEDESKKSKYDPIKRRHHLVILPKDSIGLQRLFHLVSRGYLEGFYRFPRIDYQMLKEAAEGGHLIVSTACVGGPMAAEIFGLFPDLGWDDLNASLLDDKSKMKLAVDAIDNVYKSLTSSVGIENVYLELQFNKLPPQHLVNRVLIEYARINNCNDKLIVTCDSHYSRPEYWKEREIYKKLGWLNYQEMDPSKLPQSTDDLKCELYPKNAEGLWDTYKSVTNQFDFYDDEVVCNAIERTHDIAHEQIGNPLPNREMKLPQYPLEHSDTSFKELVILTKKGLVDKGFASNKEYIDRLKFELSVIREKEFSNYFLTMKRIIDIAAKHMFIGAGRGSGAGSLVNYVLGITNVDPVEYGLLFERFLSVDRSDAPDIDSDVSDRDTLIKLLKKEFGNLNVVPISNYNTFKLKSLIKDVSRFYGVPFQLVNKMLSSLDRDVKRGRKNDIDAGDTFDIQLDEAIKYSEALSDFFKEYPQVLEPIEVLFKQNKTIGKHAGGVIIADDIQSQMPLITVKGEPQTPWTEGMTNKHLEEFGWIKFDLLGLETLRIIERTIYLILKNKGIPNSFKNIKTWFDENMDPKVIDFNDQSVYNNVYHGGNFCGTFQCTNRGAQSMFKRAKPTSLMDIATLTSIFRPGPLSAKVDKTYIKAKNNNFTEKYGNELIDTLLKPTYGHVIFQEQVMELSHVVAGIPKAECNAIRKMMKPAGNSLDAVRKTKALEKRFINGCASNKVPKPIAKTLFDDIMKFASYSFNLSHALSYGVNSFYCAWMQTYFQDEWVQAYLETVSNNPKKLSRALSEVKRLGYSIVPIDINKADKTWICLPGQKLMPSFLSCKGLGDAAIDELMEMRPFNNLKEMFWTDKGKWRFTKFNKKSILSLIKIRAFESTDWNDHFVTYKQFHNVFEEGSNSFKKSLKKNPWAGFDNFVEAINESTDESNWSIQEMMTMEEEMLGTINVENLMPRRLVSELEEKGVIPLDEYKSKDLYWMIVTKTMKKNTKNGKPYLLIEVVGTTGSKEKIFVWGTGPEGFIPEFTLCVCELDKSDFGFATQWRKVKVFEI